MTNMKAGMPKAKHSKNYGPGTMEANPFFGGEEHEFKGEPYTIISPHGSEFKSAPVRGDNVMNDVIRATKHAGGAKKGKK